MRKILFLSFLLMPLLAMAQTPWHTIEGNVVDSLSGEPIPYAQILISKNSEMISGGVSDSNGNFVIKKLPEGKYLMAITFIGYEPYSKYIDVVKGAYGTQLGQVMMKTTTVSLNAVEITASQKTASSKLDRKTYKTSDFETTTGGTATDVLNKLPSVSVGPDGDVSVRGVSDFMVYLNGKPTQMEPSMLLAQLPADGIESIDVITVPSAKYDAQGKGGIINISTKRSANNRLAVTANGMYGNAPWGNYTGEHSGHKMTDERYNAGVNMVYNKDKLSAYGGINYSLKNVNGNRDGDARIKQSGYSTENTTVYRHMVAAGNRPEWYENFNANAGVSYKLSELSELSVAYYYGRRKEGRSAYYIYNIFYAGKDKDPIEEDLGIPEPVWIFNPNTDNRYGNFQTGNIDYNYTFNDHSKLKSSLIYEYSGLSRELVNTNYGYDKSNETVEWDDKQLQYHQSDNTPLQSFRVSLDYEKDLANGNSLSAGLQPQFTGINGDFKYDTLNVNVPNDEWGAYSKLENGIDLKRNIYAGYVDYAGTFNKLTYSLGVRLEYMDQVLNLAKPVPDSIIIDHGDQTEFKVQKLDFFPTLHFRYELNELSKFNLAATRRINRPPVKNMAPFLYRRHLEVYVIGDPELKPEYSNSLELGYDRKLGKQDFNITGFYRGTNNAIFRVNTVYDENRDGNEDVLIRSYTNSGNTTALGAELNANLVAGSITKIFLGGSLYHYNIKADIFGYQENNSSLNWSLKGNFNFFLTKAWKLTADFNVKSATVTAQGNNEMFYMGNAALNYNPLKNKAWNFQAKILDAFSSNQTGLDTRARDVKGQELFYQKTTYYRQGPIMELNISYAFNKALKAPFKPIPIGNQEF